MHANNGIVELERRYAAPVSEVFAAWASAEAMLAWSGMPADWTMRCNAFRLEVGHADQWSFGPTGETPYINMNRYVVIEPGRQIVYTTTLSHDDRTSFAGAVAVTFDDAEGGCRLTLHESGVYLDGDDSEGHRQGWSAMLDTLAEYLARDLMPKKRVA